jgi:hypothetical protein
MTLACPKVNDVNEIASRAPSLYAPAGGRDSRATSEGPMTLNILFAASALAFALAGAAQARPLDPEAPGLDVEDRCTAEALLESGWEGAIRVRTPARADGSLNDCDIPAVALEVPDFVAVAKPCLAQGLRAYGYRGRIRPPHHSAFTSQDPVCEFDYGADASEFGAPDPADADDLATFRRSDGMEVTTMRPVPNPEDLPPRDRARVYGRD